MSNSVTPPSSAAGPTGPRAGFFPRFGAALIDWVILFVVGLVLPAVLGRVAGTAVGILIGISYFGYLEGSASGQTLGKRALGIRVIDYRTGGPIGFGRAVLRYFARIISTLPCLLGYFWMLWDKERQTWHDKLISDVVVPTSAYPVSSWPN
jgi:uncharacterized RDD family membrane protein YckC